jgi:hypothetical protein
VKCYQVKVLDVLDELGAEKVDDSAACVDVGVELMMLMLLCQLLRVMAWMRTGTGNLRFHCKA